MAWTCTCRRIIAAATTLSLIPVLGILPLTPSKHCFYHLVLDKFYFYAIIFVFSSRRRTDRKCLVCPQAADFVSPFAPSRKLHSLRVPALPLLFTLSHSFALFCTFLHASKTYLPSFLHLPRSCPKTPGVATPSAVQLHYERNAPPKRGLAINHEHRFSYTYLYSLFPSHSLWPSLFHACGRLQIRPLR
jgi:hypothetical protein